MVYRWRFRDPYDTNPATNTYTVPLNPNRMGSVYGPRSVTAESTTAVDGQSLLFEGNARPVEWFFAGEIIDAAHYEALRSWVYDRRRRILLHDHFGRELSVVLTSFAPTPPDGATRRYYWRHTYEVRAYVLKVGPPSIGLGQDNLRA